MSDEFDDAPDPTQLRRDTRPPEGARGRYPPTASRLISRLYVVANRPLRAKLLACLLRPLSPLGLVAIAAGAFGGFLHRSNAGGLRIAIDDVSRFSSEQIGELARFVEQVSPEALQGFASLILDNPAGIAAFSASAAVLLLRGLRPSPGAEPLLALGADEQLRRNGQHHRTLQVVGRAEGTDSDRMNRIRTATKARPPASYRGLST